MKTYVRQTYELATQFLLTFIMYAFVNACQAVVFGIGLERN